jgi:TonB family protein
MLTYEHHARLAVAVVAAASLHGLVLYALFESPARDTPEIGRFIELELVKSRIDQISQERQPTSTAAPTAALPDPHQLAHHPARKPESKEAAASVPVRSERHKPQSQAVAMVAKALVAVRSRNSVKEVIPENHDTPAAASPSQAEAEAAPQDGPAVVPMHVQRQLLARVHYPRVARRHGWQGRVELQLDIRQQSIQEISTLVSSGRPVLDRAARRGLKQVGYIALADGLYRMPVTFRLQ